jgi:DNA-binding MarR family transcriptional regulator
MTRRRQAGSAPEAMDTFTREVALLFFRMRVAARQYLGQGRHSAGRRGLLKSLRQEGPQTVPRMARARAVSRQHIQKLVNELRRDRLVQTRENPRHRRSRLVALTARGRAFLRTLISREQTLMAFVGEGLSTRRLRQAVALVRLVRQRLESAHWQRLANAALRERASRLSPSGRSG